MNEKVYQAEVYSGDLVIVGEDDVCLVGKNKKLNVRLINCQNVRINTDLESLAILFCPNVSIEMCDVGFLEVSFSDVKMSNVKSLTGIIANSSVRIENDFNFKGLMKECERTLEVGDGAS